MPGSSPRLLCAACLLASCGSLAAQLAPAGGDPQQAPAQQAPGSPPAFQTQTTNVEVHVSREELAQEEIAAQEKQRVLGIFPNFYTSYAWNAVPLTARQKFQLAGRSVLDPVSFVAAGIAAGVQQSQNDFRGYGQGAAGFGRRFGANYGNGLIGTFIGGAALPSLLHQDPRYFYKGTGTVLSRSLYAIAMSVVCRGDNGRWQPDYSNVLGDLAAGGISDLYYPASDRNGAATIFENTAIGLATGSAGNLIQEFLIRKLTPHLHAAPKP